MSSAVSTPSSAASPGAVAPALAPAMQSKTAPVMSPTPGLAGSVTTREWVIPPRPKPGRKPATDTPPTKRKAQNRAAQRAFRERRAARVGELEEQIKKIEDDHDFRELELRNQIASLSRDLEQSQNEVSWWKKRCHSLEQDVARERNEKEALQKQGATTVLDAVPIKIRKTNKRSKDGEQRVSDNGVSHHSAVDSQQEHLAGCDGCSTTHCQCLEDAIHISNLIDKPASKDDDNQTHEPAIKYDPDQMEIDFTARFATTRPPTATEPRATSTPPTERCGFCGDGTVCICAEMSDQPSRQDALEQNRLAPIQNYSSFTPPPSDGDVREVTLPPISQATNPCANGPGTCAQCQADPRSTLFCKSLAASRAASGLSGCCGGKGQDGGCCKSRPQSRVSVARDATPLTLTCADAFTTLSRHPNFSQASDELASWLPKLHALPKPREPSLGDALGSSIASRPALEVEAASVMGVLRYFDRRFASK